MNSLRLLQFASSIYASMRRITLGRSQIVVHFLLSSISILPSAAIGQKRRKALQTLHFPRGPTLVPFDRAPNRHWFVSCEKAPHCGALWAARGRFRLRAFILCFYRTGRFPAQFPIGGAKAGANSADVCPGCRDAILAPKAAHSGSQGRTRRLHLHLRSLCLLLTKLLGILAQAHAGLLLAKRLHLAQ